MKKHSNIEDALRAIQSGMRVFVHGGAATPNALIDALIKQAPKLRNVEFIHLHTMGQAAYARSEFAGSFRVSNLFLGENMRHHFDANRIDYLPCFLSEIPHLFRSGRIRLDAALLHLSTPDQHGMCSLGVSVDVAKAAIDSAKVLIAQLNPRMPRVHGDGFVPISRIDHYVEVDEPIPELKSQPLSKEDESIGNRVAGLIENGATIQVGIGAVPDAVLKALQSHKHLGIHTEMWSDGALKLIECEAVDNSLKRVHPGKTVSGFVIGSRRLYDFINDNPSVVQLDVGYVNDTNVIARNPKVAAINSAVEVDLTGQVCADSVGQKIISGVGGQMDFIRGASKSVGGKPIIALRSRTKSGQSRIVPILKAGAGVVTTRAHVHYVVTEYGLADLYGKTLRERRMELIKIAHPDDREWLEKSSHN